MLESTFLNKRKKKKRKKRKMASSQDLVKVKMVIMMTKIRNKEESSALCNKLSCRNKRS